MSADAAVPMAWEVLLRLEASQIDAPEVQWSVFEQDPMPRFEKELAARARSCREWLDRIQDESTRGRTRLSFLRAAWDHLYQTLTEERLHLAPARRSGAAVGFNASEGRKWVVTKATREAYCWCVSVDAVVGQATPITLGDANATNLGERDWPPLP
jgi:hypothetical protein